MMVLPLHRPVKSLLLIQILLLTLVLTRQSLQVHLQLFQEVQVVPVDIPIAGHPQNLWLILCQHQHKQWH